MIRDCCYGGFYPNIPRGCGKTQSILEQLCSKSNCHMLPDNLFERDTDKINEFISGLRYLGGSVALTHEMGSIPTVSIEIPYGALHYLSIRYKNNGVSGIPKVARVDTYNDRVVKVTFTDGSFTKSVCGKNDIFDLDVGITICVMKKMLGKNGHKLYNDMIRDIHSKMEKNKKEEELAKQLKNEAKQRKRKAELKKAAKLVKAKQEYIDAQKTAVVEALRAYKEESGDDMK